MDLGIKDKVVLVTGGARGLGRAVCLKFAEEGAFVATIDVIEGGAEKTAREIQDSGGKAMGFDADITDRDRVEKVVEAIELELGPVQILVNNAAHVQTMARFVNLTGDLWKKDLEINLTGTFNVTKAIFPGMLDRKWGRIVSLASIAGRLGSFGQTSYATSKAGTIGFAKCLALEGARFGVTSNVVVPGMIGTEMMNTLIEPKKIAARKRIALGREGVPDDIANAVVFLCSERARYITGAVINVTGGMELLALTD